MRKRLLRDALVALFLACVGLPTAVAVFPDPARIATEGWIGMGLSVFVLYLYADHLANTAWDYLEHRGVRRLRGLMIAILLVAGCLGIVMGTVARYVPEVAEPARFVRWITLGMLFVGGISSWVSWRWPGSEHD